MILHKDEVNFRESVLRTSGHFKIASNIIVKDYFVTLFLKTLETNFPNFIFKGGTSLSKCYKEINRFSEDIDLSYYPMFMLRIFDVPLLIRSSPSVIIILRIILLNIPDISMIY